MRSLPSTSGCTGQVTGTLDVAEGGDSGAGPVSIQADRTSPDAGILPFQR